MKSPSKYSLRSQVYFKDMAGEPFKLTAGQEQIFKMIYEPDIRRGTVKAITQYGKSEVAAMAIVSIAVERKEKILVVAPSLKQSAIIMGKVIDHFFDHPFLTGMLEYTGRLEQLRRERSKTRLTTKNGSEIMILTAEAKTVARQARGLMGFGATLVICLPYDEKLKTNKGNLKIGEIVEKKLKVKILSFNHKTKRTEYKEIEKYEKNIGHALLEFDLGNKKFRCTEDHLVFVKNKGYVKAKEVKEGDIVLCVSG